MDKFSGELRCHLNPFNHPILGFVIAYVCEGTLTVRPLFLHAQLPHVRARLCPLKAGIPTSGKNGACMPPHQMTLRHKSQQLTRSPICS